jgi:hypothetical protein
MQSIRRAGLGIVATALLCALPGAAQAGGSIALRRSIGFAEGTFVRPAVIEECTLEEQLPQFVQEFAQKEGIAIELVDTLPGSGRVLELEITNVLELGNGFVGRQKGLDISGRLLENGVVVGNFRGRRATTGGFMGGYKGACAFFGRCAKALGKDVADWLKAPTKDAVLGS